MAVGLVVLQRPINFISQQGAYEFEPLILYYAVVCSTIDYYRVLQKPLATENSKKRSVDFFILVIPKKFKKFP